MFFSFLHPILNLESKLSQSICVDLSRNVFQGIFKKGYRLPTPIQRRAIPKALAGHDVVCQFSPSLNYGYYLIIMS